MAMQNKKVGKCRVKQGLHTTVPGGDTGIAVREQKPAGINTLQHRHTPPQPMRRISADCNRSIQSEGTVPNHKHTETAAYNRLTGLKIGIPRRKQ